MNFWTRVPKFDSRAARFADNHYSRRTPGSAQFMPPGETIVLVREVSNFEVDALFGWWRPHPRSGIKAMNGLDGWTCTIFRNETGVIFSSVLIEMAETFLHGNPTPCGPSGLITYVWDKKVRSVNPGFCFKKAGYVRTGKSADGKKTLLQKPFKSLEYDL